MKEAKKHSIDQTYTPMKGPLSARHLVTHHSLRKVISLDPALASSSHSQPHPSPGEEHFESAPCPPPSSSGAPGSCDATPASARAPTPASPSAQSCRLLSGRSRRSRHLPRRTSPTPPSDCCWNASGIVVVFVEGPVSALGGCWQQDWGTRRWWLRQPEGR